MDGLQQIGLPLVGIAAVAVLTFYAVSFSELREKSFIDLEEKEDSDGNNGGFKSSLSSRERRARRKAEKKEM